MSAGLPQAERQLFEEARRAEFRDERPKDAAVLLDKTCRSPAVDRRQRQWLSLALAFNAHRRGDAATRDSLLDELLDEVQQDISVPASSPEEAPRPAKPPFQSVTCGLMLLCTHSRREIPEWIEDAFRTVSPTLGRATLERIASLSDERVSNQVSDRFEALSSSFEKTVAHRNALRTVQTLVPSLLGDAPIEPRIVDGRLLFYFPTSPKDGEGALIDIDAIAALIDHERPKEESPFSTVSASGKVLVGEAVTRAAGCCFVHLRLSWLGDRA